jgi:hypothetical protein
MPVVTDPATWAPTLEQVAGYVTSRTVDLAVPGSDTPLGTFTGNTWPTDTQVRGLIDIACRWVTTRTGPVDSTLVDNAADVAALRAAGMVEASYPVRAGNVDTANLLLKQADTAKADLVAAMQNITGVNPTPVGSALPQYSFPDPHWYGDRDL